ncbi:MAG TPA: hypothetical protein VMQ54_08815 [Steroidobacteraceae bacterium]|jgi:hypothetical protein|nr:hypothetical protein [Steroidobacteraceae bacterium]
MLTRTQALIAVAALIFAGTTTIKGLNDPGNPYLDDPHNRGEAAPHCSVTHS